MSITQGSMSQNITNIATALCLCQGEMEDAKKDSTNPFYSSNYANLASVRLAARDPMLKQGLSITQIVREEPRQILPSGDIIPERTILDTLLLHKSGEWIKSSFPLYPPTGGKNGPNAQDWGSLITYVRRYMYKAILGLADVDDDGNSATGNVGAPATAASLPQAKPGAIRPVQAVPNANLPAPTNQKPGEPPPGPDQLAMFRNKVATTNLADPAAVERAKEFVRTRISDASIRKSAEAYLNDAISKASEKAA